MQYRDLVNRFASYEQRLRDRQISYNGIETNFVEAGEGETALDYFGDQLSAPANLISRTYTVIPDYNQYYMLMGLVGEDFENDFLALEVKCRTDAVIPIGSVFPLPIKGTDGVIRTQYWRVSSSDVRHVDVLYGKILKCVPARQGPTGELPDPTVIQTPSPATFPGDPVNFEEPTQS